MRKPLLLLISILFTFSAFAVQHSVQLSGFSYSPATLNVNVGDTINFQASNVHPLRQVSEATWNTNGTTALSGGWGTKTSNYQHIVSALGDIFYVCSNHAGSGMKGKVIVSALSSVVSQNLKQYSVPTFFPNPAPRDNAKIYTTEPTTLVITDAIGNHIVSANINGLWNCNLPRGLYFYYTVNGSNKRSKTQKLIIED